MRSKYFTILLILCSLAAIECQRGKGQKQRRGPGRGKSSESSESIEKEINSCEIFCERRAELERNCLGKRGKKGCRIGIRQRSRGKFNRNNCNCRQVLKKYSKYDQFTIQVFFNSDCLNQTW